MMMTHFNASVDMYYRRILFAVPDTIDLESMIQIQSVIVKNDKKKACKLTLKALRKNERKKFWH